MVKEHKLESICLWAHGMDVDLAILRSLCRRFDIELYMRELDFALVSRLTNALHDNGMTRAHARDIAVDEANQYAIAYFTLTLRE
jgi:hypothetical protein